MARARMFTRPAGLVPKVLARTVERPPRMSRVSTSTSMSPPGPPSNGSPSMSAPALVLMPVERSVPWLSIVMERERPAAAAGEAVIDRRAIESPIVNGSESQDASRKIAEIARGARHGARRGGCL